MFSQVGWLVFSEKIKLSVKSTWILTFSSCIPLFCLRRHGPCHPAILDNLRRSGSVGQTEREEVEGKKTQPNDNKNHTES